MPHKRKDLKIKGPNLWYLVGLITSDGNLSSDGRHIDITSGDYEFLRGVKEATGIENKIGVKYNGKKRKYFHIQFANKNFYNFLLSIGLKPNKSLTLKQVNVSEMYFLDFLRGLIDGDGGMQRWIHHTNKREQWNLRISSGSLALLQWLQNKIEEVLRVKGKIYIQSPSQIRLKYGKMAARVIARRCYYEDCLGMRRKIILAGNCVHSYEGWKKSKTVVECLLK